MSKTMMQPQIAIAKRTVNTSAGQIHAIRALSLIEILVVIAILAILAAVFIPTFRAQVEKGHLAKCTTNLRTISNAALLYASDNNGSLGGATDMNSGGIARTGGRFYHWPTDYLPYIGVKDATSPARMYTPTPAYLCPMNKQFKATRAWHTSYGMNWLLSNPAAFPWPRLQAIRRPSQTVLFMTFWNGTVSATPWFLKTAPDRKTQILPYQNNTRANVAFVDGHVKLMTMEELNPPSGYTMNPDVAGAPWTYR